MSGFISKGKEKIHHGKDKLEEKYSKLFSECWHCWYIEPRNREKSLRLILQRFSCLLDEWIAKI